MSQIDTKKAIYSWSLYDWANSAFATTVMAGFFPLFFKQYWSAGADATESTLYLGLANSVGSIIVALLAPILGAIADRSTSKKKFLLFFAFLGVVMTCCMYWVGEGQWPIAAFLYVMAAVGFSGANNFYDSILPGVASKKKMNSVSALGYSIGYLGGGVLFALNVLMFQNPETFGLANGAEAVKFSFLTVGIWWAVFSIPLFLFVKEPPNPKAVSGGNYLKEGVKQVIQLIGEIRNLKMVFLFLVAYWLYIDGVDTIVRMSVDYGLSIGFEASDLITALLMVQFIGFPAAIAYGYLGDKIGSKNAILLAIGIYLFISIWGAFMDTKNEFYILAATIGLVQGGIQALSRSYYATMIPKHKAAEFFGFYNMLGKFAAVIGPTLMGMVGVVIKNVGWGTDAAARGSIASVAILFIIGGILFYKVDVDKAREEVRAIYGDDALVE